MSIAHPNPIEQIYNSITSTLHHARRGRVAEVRREVAAHERTDRHRQSDVSPVRQRIRLAARALVRVILNVNLAILNMLPIPVLDGGHIVLALVESARRKPVNTRLLEVIQTACAVLIIGYMLYITFFDVQDLPFIRDRLEKTDAPAQRGEIAP